MYSKVMWKTLVIVWICLATRQIQAKEPFQCGDYEIQGILRSVDGKKVLKLYEGSGNETTLSLSEDLSRLAEMYIDDSVTIKGRLFAPVEGYSGQIHSLTAPGDGKEAKSDTTAFSERYAREDIKKRDPDPLHPDLDSSVKLLKEGPCGYKNEPKKKSR